jgi:Cu(I)/Ag(I) efflux system membrane fusion protein
MSPYTQKRSLIAEGAGRRIAVSMALLAGLLLLAGCPGEQASEPAAQAADDTAAEHALKHTYPLYRCPMHPEIVSDEPGECPICGMDLVEEEPDTGAHSVAEPGASPGVHVSPAVINKLGVRTEAASRERLERRAETVGYLGYDERRVQQVRPRAEGWIEGLAIRATGDPVEAGQLLFRLYSPMLESAQQEYLDALAIGNQELIEASRARLRALGLDAGTANRLARSGRAGGRVPFVAPVSGVVTTLEVEEGSMVTPEMVVLTITELDSLWVIAEIPEAQSGWVRAGTGAELSFPAMPGRTLNGRVEYVYPELDPETRSVRARITLDAPPGVLRPNMLASISLLGEPGEPVVNIPRSALIRSGTEDRVVVALGDGRFQPRRVVPGLESGERIAILEGLAAGEEVVVSGQFLLDSEANLRAGLRRLESEPEREDAGRPADDGAEETSHDHHH